MRAFGLPEMIFRWKNRCFFPFPRRSFGQENFGAYYNLFVFSLAKD